MRSLPQRFYRWSGRWERLIYKLTAFTLGLMIISQLLMVNEQVRLVLSRVDYLEGIPYLIEDNSRLSKAR